MTTYFLHHDALGNVIGNAVSIDDTQPDGDFIECSADQYNNISAYRVDMTKTPPAIISVDASIILGRQQTDAWNDIKAKRDGLTSNGGVEVAVATGTNKWFQTDDSSRIQYLGLKDTARDMLAAGHVMSDALQLNSQVVNWKTYDNSFVALTLQNVFDIVAAVKTLDAEAFANAETHRENMLKVADPTTYDYSTGWPPVFTGA